MVGQNHQMYRSNHTLEHRKKEIKGIEFCCAIFSCVVIPMFASAGSLPYDGEVPVKDFAFAETLMNPCGYANGSYGIKSLSAEDRLTAEKMLAKEFDFKTKIVSRTASDIYTSNVFDDCSSLSIPPVTFGPNVTEELENPDLLEMNRVVHSSLLGVTARVYFTVSQLEKYSGVTCRHDHGLLLERAGDLRNKMRELLCIHRMYLVTLSEEGEDDPDAISQVLEETLSDQPLCSRRLLRDCQTMHGAARLLDEVAKFHLASTAEKPE